MGLIRRTFLLFAMGRQDPLPPCTRDSETISYNTSKDAIRAFTLRGEKVAETSQDEKPKCDATSRGESKRCFASGCKRGLQHRTRPGGIRPKLLTWSETGNRGERRLSPDPTDDVPPPPFEPYKHPSLSGANYLRRRTPPEGGDPPVTPIDGTVEGRRQEYLSGVRKSNLPRRLGEGTPRHKKRQRKNKQD